MTLTVCYFLFKMCITLYLFGGLWVIKLYVYVGWIPLSFHLYLQINRAIVVLFVNIFLQVIHKVFCHLQQMLPLVLAQE